MANIIGSFSASVDLEGMLDGVGIGDQQRRIFELRAGPFIQNELEVVSFEGSEAISALFRFDVTCIGDIDPLVLEPALLGQPATLVMQVPRRAPRVVQGIVSAITVLGRRTADSVHEYRVRIVPKIWLLRRRRNTRIFQDVGIDKIVRTLLDEWRIPHRFSLVDPCQNRQYCVQYRETDYDFIARLLAEEGIFFHFEPPSGLLDELTGGLAAPIAGAVGAVGGMIGGAIGDATNELAGLSVVTETIVFSDRATAYPPIDGDGIEAAVMSSVGGAISGAISAQVGSAFGSEAGAIAGAVLDIPGPSVPFRPLHQQHSDECVYSFSAHRAIKPKAVFLKDYDFRRPNLSLTAKQTLGIGAGGGGPLGAAVGAVAGAATANVAMSFGGAAASFTGNVGAALGISTTPGTLLDPTKFEIYEHHGDFEENDVTQRRAQVELEQARRRAERANGMSTCRRFVAGRRFVLEDHVEETLDREYVLTKVKHRGVVPHYVPEPQRENFQTYENTFECAPATNVVRPKRPRRKLEQVAESAVVVGPGDVYTDEYGRIKVQFQWDRVGQRDEYSSCWIRVTQPWAGASWGVQFIPRCGMEVLVTFLGGDEDRPVVVGCLYNGTHPPPFPVPIGAARSGIRTQSYPGGSGYNELSFYDETGNESVLLRAERDFIHQVGKSHRVQIGDAHSLNVKGSEDYSVAVDRNSTIGGNDVVAVLGDRKANVTGLEQRRVHGNRIEIVDGNAETYSKQATTTTFGKFVQTTLGDQQLTVGAADEDDPKKTSQYTVNVHGDSRYYSTKTTRVVSDEKIVFTCGTSTLTMEKDKISIHADAIEMAGSKSITATAKGPALRLTDEADLSADTIKFFSKGAYMSLDKDKAKLFGPSVQMSSGDDPPDHDDQSEDPKTQHFKYKLMDYEHKPYANKTYTLITQGFKIKATTDGDGYVEQDLPDDAVSAQITLWSEDYPTGPRVVCTVALHELAPATEVFGAVVRLRNLGYYQGVDSDELTEEIKESLTWFQSDHDLPPKGDLDGDTSSKLQEIHGS